MLDPQKLEIMTKKAQIFFSFLLKKGNPVNTRNNVKAEVVVASEINEALYSIKLWKPWNFCPVF
jgi:hypothetical protein